MANPNKKPVAPSAKPALPPPAPSVIAEAVSPPDNDLTSAGAATLADLAAEDDGDAVQPEESAVVAGLRLELAAAQTELEHTRRLADVEVKRLERHVTALKEERNTLEDKLEEALAKLAAAGVLPTLAPVERPAEIPADFVLVGWKGGVYAGLCFTLKGERLPRAGAKMVGYFPKRMVEKLPDQFEKV